VAACGAQPIPLRTEYVITIVAPKEYWLLGAEPLRVGQIKFGL
jgi:hypothetical protein